MPHVSLTEWREQESDDADWHDGSDLNFSLRTPPSLRSAASSETHIPFRDIASPTSGNTYFSSWSPVIERRTTSRGEAFTASSGRGSLRVSGLSATASCPNLTQLKAEREAQEQLETKEALARTAVGYLRARDPRTRMEAFRTLRELGSIAAAPAASALELALLDPQVRIRLAAMRALSRVVALRASDSLVSTLGSLLEDPSDEVRRAAAQTLGHVVPKGDERAMREVTSRLNMPPNLWDIRASASRALGEVAPHGDRECIDLLVERVADKRHEVRLVAIPALVKAAAGTADERAVAALVRRVEDSVGEVRVEAVRALPRVAGQGDAAAVAGVCEKLQHRDWLVRLAAVRALSQVAEPGDSTALAAAGQGLEHTNWRHRDDAVRALPQLAPRGDAGALGVAGARLVSPVWETRQAAVRALGQVSQRGDERTIGLLSACLADEDVQVRSAAVRTLPEVAERGDEKAISAVRTKLVPTSPWLVRLSAAKAVEQLGGRVGDIPLDPKGFCEDRAGANAYGRDVENELMHEAGFFAGLSLPSAKQ